jgi:hypothetical protein
LCRAATNRAMSDGGPRSRTEPELHHIHDPIGAE